VRLGRGAGGPLGNASWSGAEKWTGKGEVVGRWRGWLVVLLGARAQVCVVGEVARAFLQGFLASLGLQEGWGWAGGLIACGPSRGRLSGAGDAGLSVGGVADEEGGGGRVVGWTGRRGGVPQVQIDTGLRLERLAALARRRCGMRLAVERWLPRRRGSARLNLPQRRRAPRPKSSSLPWGRTTRGRVIVI